MRNSQKFLCSGKKEKESGHLQHRVRHLGSSMSCSFGVQSRGILYLLVLKSVPVHLVLFLFLFHFLEHMGILLSQLLDVDITAMGYLVKNTVIPVSSTPEDELT